jgi:tetratricopeptide (TPR) repeat protein
MERGETGIISGIATQYTAPQEKKPEIVSKFNIEIQSFIDQNPLGLKIDRDILVELYGNTKPPINFDKVSNSHLHLWDMVKKIGEIDGNNEANERINKHGETLIDTAIYLTQRINNGTIKAGVDAAKTLATQLYSYGESLISGEQLQPITFKEIPELLLSQQQTQAVEHLLTIDKLSQLSNNPKGLILNQFFYVVGAISPPEDFKVQEANQITEALEMAITMPVRELESSIIRQKTEALSKNIPLNLKSITEKIAKFYNINIDNLSNKSRISVLKQIFEFIRSEKPSIPAEEISYWEQQVAKKIQIATSPFTIEERFKNHRFEHQPDKKVYYVSATTSSATLMQQAGINCLISNTSDASALFLATTDGRFILMDMAYVLGTYDVTNNIYKTPLPNQLPGPEGLRINNPIPKGKESHFTLYTPEDGQRILTLFNKAIAFRDRQPTVIKDPEHAKDRDYNIDKFNNYQLSIKTFKKIITSNLQDEDILDNYGKTLMMYATDKKLSEILSKEDKINSLQQAIEAWRQVIKLNPKNYEARKHIRQTERRQKKIRRIKYPILS